MSPDQQSAGDRARARIPAVGPLLGRFRLAARPEREGLPVAAWDTEARRAVSVAGLGRPLTPSERSRLARARRVTHPALAAPLAEGETVLGPVVVTELVTGRPLADGLGEEPMAPDAVRSILTPVAAGLDALHAAGLAHGALALDQIWVGEEGAVVLWGAEVPRADRTGAPDGASDVLALGGMVAWCLRAGPGGGSRPEPALPASVTAALAPDPGRRPRRAADVLAGLTSPAQAPRARSEGIVSERRPAAVAQVRAPQEEAVDAGPPVQGRRSRRWGIAAAAALLGLVLLGVGLLRAGRDEAPSRPAPRPASVRAGDVGLTAPAPWRRASAAASAERMGLRGAVALARPGTLLVAGRVVRADPVTLLPRTLRTTGRGSRVRLGRRAARRWAAPRLPGTAFLVPAVRGRPVLLACRAARPARLAACERVVTRATLPVSGPLDPDPRLAAAVTALGRGTAQAKARTRAGLARKRRPGARAAVLIRLAAAYARAARGLRRAPATPGARPVLVALARASDRIARADRRLARVLAHPRRPGAPSALREAYFADRAAGRPARVLAALGYGRDLTRAGSSP